MGAPQMENAGKEALSWEEGRGDSFFHSTHMCSLAKLQICRVGCQHLSVSLHVPLGDAEPELNALGHLCGTMRSPWWSHTEFANVRDLAVTFL